MGTGVPSSLSPPVRLHIQAVLFDKDYTTRLFLFCQVVCKAKFRVFQKCSLAGGKLRSEKGKCMYRYPIFEGKAAFQRLLSVILVANLLLSNYHISDRLDLLIGRMGEKYEIYMEDALSDVHTKIYTSPLYRP
jgi:hypothetical protein